VPVAEQGAQTSFAQFRLEQACETLSSHQGRGALEEWPLHTRCSCGWRPRGDHFLVHHQAAMVMAAIGLVTDVQGED